MEEIFLHVADARFDAALFVWLSHVAGTWLEAIVSRKVEVSRMKERVLTAGMFQDGGFWVVDEHFGWNTAEEFESVLVSAQEVFDFLPEGKLQIAQATVAKDHDKEGESPPGGADLH